MRPAKATFFGVNPPFVGGLQGVMTRQVDERLIKNDLLQLLLTLPGERVMRPTFGTALRATVFEALTDADVETLTQAIQEVIGREEPRVDVRELTLTPDPDRHGLAVRLVVTLRLNPNAELVIETFVASLVNQQ